jgi:hypothetical protein
LAGRPAAGGPYRQCRTHDSDSVIASESVTVTGSVPGRPGRRAGGGSLPGDTAARPASALGPPGGGTGMGTAGADSEPEAVSCQCY